MRICIQIVDGDVSRTGSTDHVKDIASELESGRLSVQDSLNEDVVEEEGFAC
jgi:hypothetical protein